MVVNKVGNSQRDPFTIAQLNVHSCRHETLLVGDMCYERPLAERLLGWLRTRAGTGALVLLGDPGRSYFPKDGVEKLATYRVRTTRELEDREIRETSVYRLTPS